MVRKLKGNRHGHNALRTTIFKPRQLFQVCKMYFYTVPFPTGESHVSVSLQKADSDKALLSSLTIPYFFHQDKRCVCKDGSVDPIRIYYTVSSILYDWCPGNSLSTVGSVSVSEAFTLFCVYLPYCPFQNYETWLMFQVFSHM